MKLICSLLIMSVIALENIFAVQPMDCAPKVTEKTSGNVAFSLSMKDKIKFVYLIDGDVEQQLNEDFSGKPKKYDKANGILALSSVVEKVIAKNVLEKPENKATVEVEKNGVYTICAENQKGDLFVKVVNVNNIDKIPPSEIANIEHCVKNDGSAVVTWKIPEDDDCAGVVLKMDEKEFKIKKDTTLVVLDGVLENTKFTIAAIDDVGNMSKPMESSNRLTVVENVECNHKVDYENYIEPDCVSIDISGYNLDRVTLEDFNFSSENMEFKNIKLEPNDNNNCKLKFDIPDEKGDYTFTLKTILVAKTECKDKKITISSAGRKPLICDCSLANDKISSFSDKNRVMTVKGFNLDKINQKNLMVCWAKGKDDVITGKKNLVDKNTLELNFSFSGIANYPAWDKASEPWQKESYDASRLLVLKDGAKTVKEFEIHSELETPPAPLIADGKRLPDWIGQCNFYGQPLIKFLNRPQIGVKHTLKFSENALYIYATKSVNGSVALKLNMTVGVFREDNSSEIRCVYVKNMRNGEELSLVATDPVSYAQTVGAASSVLPAFYDCSRNNISPF